MRYILLLLILTSCTPILELPDIPYLKAHRLSPVEMTLQCNSTNCYVKYTAEDGTEELVEGGLKCPYNVWELCEVSL
jgi:hypothetical protein